MHYKKVLIVLRHDARNKPGGDSNLLKEISKLLVGFDVHIAYGVPNSVADYDFVMSSNLDRPIEGYDLLKLCNKSSTPLHFMTLHHHSNQAISNYLRKGLFGWKFFIAVISNYNPIKYEQFLWNIRVCLSYLKKSKNLKFGSVANAQKKLIKECKYLLVVSRHELESIKKDVGNIASKVIYMPHVLKNNNSIKNNSIKNNTIQEKIIFCPGRIECRKNQLFILEVAENMPEYKFIFMGNVNQSDKSYVKSFFKKANKLKNVDILSALKEDDFNEFLASSNIVLTASWFEVTSLIELQVLRSGNKLVCNSLSYNDSFFTNSLVYKHNDIESCCKKIIEAYEDKFRVYGYYNLSEDIIDSYLTQTGNQI